MFTKKETDFCKGIAIILMLFHHLFNDYQEYAGFTVSYWPFSGDRLTYLALLSKVCVAIFVFLSGYGLAATYKEDLGSEQPDRKKIWHFTWSRYWKLMTGYWFIFLLTLLCQPLGRTLTDAYGNGKKNMLVYTVLDMLGLSHAFSVPSLNPTWWYMSIAIAIIFLMPFIMPLMEKIGALQVLIASVLVLQLTGLVNASTVYLFSLLLGAASFQLHLFERVYRSGGNRKDIRVLKSLILLLALCALLLLRTDYNYCGIADGLIALTLALLTSILLIKIPVASRSLQFLGKHSANMFLIHNQLYSFYFLSFFYSFKYWAVILLALVLSSLLASAIIEWLKKVTKYASFMEKAGRKFSN